MKKIYTVLSMLLIGVQIANAQLTLTKAMHEPVVGDVFNNAEYDSIAAIPKATGAGMSWNFNTALTPGTWTETITYTTVASTPSASSFPNASIAAVRGTNNTEFYRTTATMMEYDGSLDVSSNEIVTFSNRGTWILWPTSLGTTSTDAFSAMATAGTNTTSWNGTLSYTATGSGTVILPGGNVHTNCLQLKKVISLTMVSGTTTTQLTMTHYEYWSSSSKSPILSVEYQTATTGTNTSKNVSIYVSTNALTIGVSELNAVKSDLILFPNPAKDVVNVSLPNNEIAVSVEVYDLNGRKVGSALNANSIDVSALSSSVYVIRVTGKEGILQRKLIITE